MLRGLVKQAGETPFNPPNGVEMSRLAGAGKAAWAETSRLGQAGS